MKYHHKIVKEDKLRIDRVIDHRIINYDKKGQYEKQQYPNYTGKQISVLYLPYVGREDSL